MDWEKEKLIIQQKILNGNNKDFYDKPSFGELMQKKFEYELKIAELIEDSVEIQKNLNEISLFMSKINNEVGLITRKLKDMKGVPKND